MRGYGLQHFIARIAPDFVKLFKVCSQGWLIFQKAIGHQVETATWSQNLGCFADEAFSNSSRLDTSLVKRGIGDNEVKAFL